VDTVIAAETRVTGVVEGGGDLRVAGWLEGRVLLPEGTVTIERDATLRGNCVARHVIVAGTLHGDVSAEVVHVHEGGRVVGNLVAEDVALEEGAVLRGRIRAMPASVGALAPGLEPTQETAVPRLAGAPAPRLQIAARVPAAPRPQGRTRVNLVSR